MALLRKYWRHFNMVGAIVTFLFGIFLVVWGINAVAPYDEKMDMRIKMATQVEMLRTECHEMNTKIKFAQGAGFSLIQIELVFLCLVFAIFALNIRLVREIKTGGQTCGR